MMPAHLSFKPGARKVFILLAAAWLLSGCGKTTLDNAHIKIVAGELRSQAAQIKLIAAAIRSDTTTSAYRAAQLSFLGEKIRDSREKLSEGKPETGFEQHVSRAQILGRQVNDDLHRLISGGDNPAMAREVETSLEKVLDAFTGLEASLQSSDQLNRPTVR